MIRHVITWRLRAEDDDQRDADWRVIEDGFSSLSDRVPTIVELTIARDLGEAAGNADVVLIVDYEDRAGLDAYQVHPAHVVVKDAIAGLVKDRSCVDFEF